MYELGLVCQSRHRNVHYLKSSQATAFTRASVKLTRAQALVGPGVDTSLWVKRSEIKMGGQGLCTVTADGNKILIITCQAAKH